MCDFYVQTRAYVDRILIYNPTAVGLVGEMFSASGDGILDENYKIFNGTVPNEMSNSEFIIRILSNEGTIELPARDVFSVALHNDNVKDGNLENFIVVNDIPGEAEVCFIEFSKRFSRMTGVPMEVELIRKRPGDLKAEWKKSNKELLARGVDPVAQNFIIPIKLSIDAHTQEVIEELRDENVKIKFYGVDIRKAHTI